MTRSFPPVDEQLSVLRRGVVDLVDEKDLAERLERSRESGVPLRVKLGIDPSSPDIHLGHTVPLRKLRDFQRLGHRAIVLWGTATAMVGDPTGRNKTRPPLSREQVEQNKRTYREQVGAVLDIEDVEERENGEWFERQGFMDCVALASRFTLARILERDDFQKRFSQNLPISLHEFLYPLLQGWDSVELRADVEIGGTDQLFNLLVGRELQKQAGQEPQVCMTLPLIEGLDGSQKMSKSLGNYIGVRESPREMFGKSMSVPDQLMEKYFTLLTDEPPQRIAELLAGHPRDAKVALAEAIVRNYHGDRAAARAHEEFDRMFREGGLPDEVPVIDVAVDLLRDGKVQVAALLRAAGFCASNGEGRRLIAGGGVRVDGDRIGDVAQELGPGEYLLRSGKRKAVRVRIPR
ncbi:MAG: tyrosine--tRNA ligase [Planctomycetota bacterium]